MTVNLRTLERLAMACRANGSSWLAVRDLCIDGFQPDDAEYIVAASPDTVLALIAALREMTNTVGDTAAMPVDTRRLLDAHDITDEEESCPTA